MVTGSMIVDRSRLLKKTSVVLMGLLVCALGACGGAGGNRVEGPAAPQDFATRVYINGSTEPSETDIENGHRVHGALAQLYRWFLYYDNDSATLPNQLDVLSADASFRTKNGEFSARENYVQRASSVPIAWDNAHFIREVRVDFADDNRIRLNADVIYMNRGALENDKVHSTYIKFDSLLIKDEPFLPLIEEISVKAMPGGMAENFRYAYQENRLRSIAHHWLALQESTERKASDFEDIFEDQFTVRVAENKMDDMTALETWLDGDDFPKGGFHQRVRSFSYEELLQNEYQIDLELDRYRMIDGQITSEIVRQSLLVKDRPQERFPRLTLVSEKDQEALLLEADMENSEVDQAGGL